MITLDQVKIILKEAPVGKDGTILPNKKDSKKDKELTKKNIQKYSNKQPELFDTSKIGKEDPIKDVKNVSDITGGKRTGIRGKKPILPGSTPPSKKPKVIQPTIGVNQAEVSKKAKEFTDKVNKVRTDKIDKEVKRRIRQAGGSGDFSPTMPTELKKERQAKRDARIKALDTPDPFEIDTSKAAEQNAKRFGTPKPPRSVTRFDNREPFQDDDLGQRTGKTGDRLVNKPVQLKGSDKKISKKAIPQKTRPTSTPAVQGTYSNIGKGRTDNVSKFVSKVQSQKKRKSTTVYQDALNQAQTGRGPGGEYLTKDQRKAKFKQSKGETSGGSSGRGKPPSGGGGGGKPPSGGGGKPPSGGGGGGIPPIDPPKTPKFTAKDFKTRYKQYKSSYYKPGRIAKRALKFAAKRPGVAALAIAGTAIGADYLRRQIFKPKQLDRNKDFKSFELKSKGGKSLTDPSYIKSLKAIKDTNEREKQLKINRNLTDITKTKLSNDAFKQMAPGGRLTGGSGSSVYKFVTQNPRYKSKVEKTVKDRGFRVDKKTGNYSGDPYGILSKKS